MLDRTLILNASYEPLGTVSMRRALVLVMNEKAVVLSEGEQLLHAASVTLRVPSVVLLSQYVRIHRRSIPMTRRAVMQRYNFTCVYCQKRGDTLDHVVPRSRGGLHTWTNVVVACRPCNNRKADRLLSEIGWTLPIPLTEPAPSTGGQIATRESHPEWDTYLDGWGTRRSQLLAS